MNRSVFQMLEDLAKFPKDLTDWENGLVSNCLRIAHSDGTSTRRLSDKQVEQINRIWKTHHGQSEE